MAAAAAGRAAGTKFCLPHSEKYAVRNTRTQVRPLFWIDTTNASAARKVAAWRLKFQRGYRQAKGRDSTQASGHGLPAAQAGLGVGE